MNLTGMQKVMIASVGIAVLFVAVFLLLILPMFGTLAELDQKERDAEAIVQQTQLTLEQLREAKRRASGTQADLVRLSNQMPDNPELPSLIVELQNICNDSHMLFAAITPNKPEYKGGNGDVPLDLNFTEVRIDMTVEGTWADLLELLRRIDKIVRLQRISSISIGPILQSSVGGAPGDKPFEPLHPLLRATITMKVFVVGDNGVMVAPESSLGTATAPPAEGGAAPAP